MNGIRLSGLALAVAGAALAAAVPAAAQQVSVTNLVTDDPSANPALITDPGLLNAWGVSASATSPFWVSSNGGGTSTIYRVDPATQATSIARAAVTIPGAGTVTGQVFNAGGTSQFGGNSFLFVSEDGTVSAWRSALGSSAQTLSTGPAVYKGAAYATVAGSSYLYAADFAGGAIAVFKGSAAAPSLSGSFADPTLPAGYAPFNVQSLGGSLYVAYAQKDPASPDELAGPGYGYVDRYDLQGNLISRIASGGPLNAPWGLAIAPASFGTYAGALLVGNFGDGRISAYDTATASLLGPVTDASGQPIAIDGLWALSVGNNAAAGSNQAVYFTAGPDYETHGLFGVLQAVPEPGSPALLGAGLCLLVWRGRRRLGGR